MKRFLFLSSLTLLFILFVVLFVSSSAKAVSPYDDFVNLSTDVILENKDGSCRLDVSKSWYDFFITSKPALKSELNEAFNTGAYALSVDDNNLLYGKTVGINYIKNKVANPALFTGTPGTDVAGIHAPYDGSWFLNIEKNSSDECLVYANSGFSNGWLSYRIGSKYENLKLVFSTYDITYPQGYSGLTIPKFLKTKVKLPLFMMQNEPKSGKPNSGDLIIQIDPDMFKKVNPPSTPLPLFYDIRLFKEDLTTEVDPSDDVLKRSGFGMLMWTDLPHGNYRVIAMGFYVKENFDKYVVIPSTVDIKVDKDGFTYRYNPETDKSCFTRNGISISFWDFLEKDPDTGGWMNPISPNTSAERCAEQNSWDKTFESAFEVDGDFDKYIQCQTFDLACHLSRFWNTVTAWVMNFFTYLLVPKQEFWSAYIKMWDNMILDNLGFLGYPFHFFGELLAAITNNSSENCVITVANPTSIISDGTPFNFNFCIIKNMNATLWNSIVIPLRAAVAIGLIFMIHRRYINFIEERA